MSDAVVMLAVRLHLQQIPDLPPIYWPNQSIDGATTPYLIFDEGSDTGQTITTDGEERFELRPQVSLMLEKGLGTTERDTYLEPIKQAFKVNTDIMDQGVAVARSLRTPSIPNGRPDAGMFRTDMILRIETFQQQ